MKSFSNLLVALSIPVLLSAQRSFDEVKPPAAPDYSLREHWSCLPFRTDAADFTLENEASLPDSLKPVDVFYIYPTLFRWTNAWNAPLDYQKLNRQVDQLPVRLQAGVFNQYGRIYAPRYRQGHIRSFEDVGGDGGKALNLAYEDVLHAFFYYLKNFNSGRPFILAGHSQGTLHASRLLKEVIDTSADLRAQLVSAWLVGYTIDSAWYRHITPCREAGEFGCYLNWASYKEGTEEGDSLLVGNCCIHPLLWKFDSTKIEANPNQSAILLNPKNPVRKPTEARVFNNMVLVKHGVPLFRRKKNLHLLDYNLFWFSIRRNAEDQVHNYIRHNGSSAQKP
jgi:hypothetical protein